MPQTTFQMICGYVRLTIDTLLQRFINRNVIAHHQLFASNPSLLAGKTAVITGANTGLGFETTKWLASSGAKIIMACRNTEKAETAANRIQEMFPSATLEIQALDLSDFASVRQFASAQHSPIDMLVLNAGLMGVPLSVPETHFYVNYLAHFLLTLLLLPNVAAAHGRIVLVSSLTSVVSDLRFDDISFANRSYNFMTAYANSKLAMLLFMRALATRLKRKGSMISVLAVHPGESTTDVARYLGSMWMWLHKRFGRYFLLSPEESARTIAYAAAASEIRGKSNVMLHAISRTVQMPQHLVCDEHAEQLWKTSLQMSKVQDPELERIESLIGTTTNEKCVHETHGIDNLQQKSKVA